MTDQVTPRPWVVGRTIKRNQYVEIDSMEDGSNTLLGHKSWQGLAFVNGCYDEPEKGIRQAEINAHHIVKCVNNHERLAEALRECTELLDEYHDHIWHESGCGKNPGCTDAEPFKELLSELEGDAK